ncbi:MAG: 3-deoxy-D-manno-octulosonic acid transferase [Candidatus Binatia bacterium]
MLLGRAGSFAAKGLEADARRKNRIAGDGDLCNCYYQTYERAVSTLTAFTLRLLWATILTIGSPAIHLFLLWRAKRGKEIISRIQERKGIDKSPRPRGPVLWVHAASIGEVNSILPTLVVVLSRSKDITILFTTGTVSSATVLHDHTHALGISNRVLHRFAPLDVPYWITRFLHHWRPEGACFVESELWPNQLIQCKRQGIKVMLVNGRLSSRSFSAWQRIPSLAKNVLASFYRIHARGPRDAMRFQSLGSTQVGIIGDLKFAAPRLSVNKSELATLHTALANRPIWLAASTHPGEEMLIAAAHHLLVIQYPSLLTIIVPRHPERGSLIAAKLDAPCRADVRSPPTGGIWIANTLGELGLWYRLCSVAFIGRSLLPPGGGQNLLEAARLRCVVIIGPYTANFVEHVELLREVNGLFEICDLSSLVKVVSRLLGDEMLRRAVTSRAAHAIQRHKCLPSQLASAILDMVKLERCL